MAAVGSSENPEGWASSNVMAIICHSLPQLKWGGGQFYPLPSTPTALQTWQGEMHEQTHHDVFVK